MNQQAVLPASVVHVFETASGHWIVEDVAGKKGGRFVDRRTALAFVRRELGLEAESILVEPMRDQASKAA